MGPKTGKTFQTPNPGFSPSIQRQLQNSDEYTQDILPKLESLFKAKRTFSEVSAATDQSIQATKASKAFQDDPETAEPEIREQVERKLRAKLEVCEEQYGTVNETIRVLNRKYHEGILNVSRSEFQKDLDRLERVFQEVAVDLTVLRERKNQLVGQYVDAINSDQSQDVKDWPCFDLLLSHPPGDAEQERFRNRILEAYDALEKKGGKDYRMWCCVEGAWTIHTSSIRAANIVPNNLRETNCRSIFGEPEDSDGHLWSVRNGIPMHEIYEKMFDGGAIGLMPVEGTDDIKIVAFKTEPMDPICAHLDGRILKFRTDMRPRKRYLYFQFCMSLLRRQRHWVRGWWREYTKHELPQIWAGECLKKSALCLFAAHIAHLDPSDAKDFAYGDDNPAEESKPATVRMDTHLTYYVLAVSGDKNEIEEI